MSHVSAKRRHEELPAQELPKKTIQHDYEEWHNISICSHYRKNTSSETSELIITAPPENIQLGKLEYAAILLPTREKMPQGENADRKKMHRGENADGKEDEGIAHVCTPYVSNGQYHVQLPQHTKANSLPAELALRLYFETREICVRVFGLICARTLKDKPDYYQREFVPELSNSIHRLYKFLPKAPSETPIVLPVTVKARKFIHNFEAFRTTKLTRETLETYIRTVCPNLSETAVANFGYMMQRASDLLNLDPIVLQILQHSVRPICHGQLLSKYNCPLWLLAGRQKGDTVWFGFASRAPGARESWATAFEPHADMSARCIVLALLLCGLIWVVAMSHLEDTQLPKKFASDYLKEIEPEKVVEHLRTVSVVTVNGNFWLLCAKIGDLDEAIKDGIQVFVYFCQQRGDPAVAMASTEVATPREVQTPAGAVGSFTLPGDTLALYDSLPANPEQPLFDVELHADVPADDNDVDAQLARARYDVSLEFNK